MNIKMLETCIKMNGQLKRNPDVDMYELWISEYTLYAVTLKVESDDPNDDDVVVTAYDEHGNFIVKSENWNEAMVLLKDAKTVGIQVEDFED